MTYITDETMAEMSEDFKATPETSAPALGPAAEIWAVHRELLSKNYPFPCRGCGTPMDNATDVQFGVVPHHLIPVTAKGDCLNCGQSESSVEVPVNYLFTTLVLAVNSLEDAPF